MTMHFADKWVLRKDPSLYAAVAMIAAKNARSIEIKTKPQTRTYHSKACKKCGGTERYESNGNCVLCTRIKR